MGNKENMFSEFPKTTEKDWIEKVEKDLKGRAFQELFWQIDEGLEVAPFYHSKEVLTGVPTNKQSSNRWEIGETIFVKNPKSANGQLLNALANGVNAPRFVIDGLLDETQLSVLFDKVELSFISVHFLIKNAKSALPFLQNFYKYLSKKSSTIAEINGSVNLSGEEQLLDLINFSTAKLPNFKVLTINLEYAAPADLSKSLARTISKAYNLLAVLHEAGVDLKTINHQLQFSVSVGNSYFVEIAKIRALKILWANVLEAYGLKTATAPTIEAQLSPNTFGDDTNTNMIRATAQAMSAALGGVNRLTVILSDTDESSEFSRRIARNVQHLLMMESFMDRVIDPAKGSYYIEQLTEKIAETAWLEFQKNSAK